MISKLILSLLATAFPNNTLARPSSQNLTSTTAVNVSSVQWGPCDPAVVHNPALTCGFFDIPLDYHDPSAGNGRLILAKLSAIGERRGTVFLNPGGPGASGLRTMSSIPISQLLANITGGLYDVVSWDPRGVGSFSIPGEVHCFDSPEEYQAFWNGTIELDGIQMTGNFSDPEDVQALLAQAPIMQAKYDELGRRCLRGPSGKYLRYVGTAATVRDVVALADALDGPGAPVNYMGFSYGTMLGQWLINMFPERVGRVINDGVLDPRRIATEETLPIWALNELADIDKVYEGFLTGCALAGPEGCPISTAPGQSAADIDATIQALMKQAHDAARANASVPVNSMTIRVDLVPVMYNPVDAATFANTTWPQLVAGVQGELGANHTQLAKRFARPIGYQHARRDAEDRNVTPSYAAEAILCSDSVDLRGTYMSEAFETIIAASRNTSQMFAVTWPAEFYYCPFWPVRAVERYQGPFNKTLANKVMVIGSTYDPVTPLRDAQAVAELLGDNARLVQYDAFGHTSISEPSECVNAVRLAYFTNNTLPEDNGTVCQADPDFEFFKGINTAAILAAMASQDNK